MNDIILTEIDKQKLEQELEGKVFSLNLMIVSIDNEDEADISGEFYDVRPVLEPDPDLKMEDEQKSAMVQKLGHHELDPKLSMLIKKGKILSEEAVVLPIQPGKNQQQQIINTIIEENKLLKNKLGECYQNKKLQMMMMILG